PEPSSTSANPVMFEAAAGLRPTLPMMLDVGTFVIAVSARILKKAARPSSTGAGPIGVGIGIGVGVGVGEMIGPTGPAAGPMPEPDGQRPLAGQPNGVAPGAHGPQGPITISDLRLRYKEYDYNARISARAAAEIPPPTRSVFVGMPEVGGGVLNVAPGAMLVGTAAPVFGLYIGPIFTGVPVETGLTPPYSFMAPTRMSRTRFHSSTRICMSSEKYQF